MLCLYFFRWAICSGLPSFFVPPAPLLHKAPINSHSLLAEMRVLLGQPFYAVRKSPGFTHGENNIMTGKTEQVKR